MAAAAAARVKSRRGRRASALDVAASTLVHVLPRRLEPLISQARLDARSVLDGLRGVRGAPFTTHEDPAERPRALREIDPVAEVLPRPLADRYQVLRRDLAMVGSELRGHRAPMLVERRAHAGKSRYDTPTRAPSALGVRSLRVTAVIRETEDARTFELTDVSGAPLEFAAGQFLTLHVEVDGTSHRRAYSISSSPASGRVRITIKRIAGGRVSQHLVASVREGDVLRAHGPSGSFVAPPSAMPRHLVLFAGGSGITPVASILRDVLAREPATRVTLVYGNRSERDTIFRAELDALGERHGARLRVLHVLSSPTTEATCVRGIPDRETVGRLLDEGELLSARAGEEPVRCFSCGPAPMMAAVREALHARGAAERLVEERFLSPADPATSPRAVGPQLVTIRGGGVARDVTVPPGSTLLEAALSQGVALPFSCQMGGCGACRCKGSGSLVMDEPNCLGEAERSEGVVLTCVARVLGPSTIELPEAKAGPR